MIFVTIGTQDKPFNRLFEYLEKADIKDQVIVQSGFTKYQSNKYQVLNYIDKADFEKYMNEADIIISHGGVGTIMSALYKHKKVIACARLKKYGEHQNDHQLQIIRSLKEQGYLLELNEENDLNDLINKMKDFKVPNIESNQMNFIERLQEYIDTL